METPQHGIKKLKPPQNEFFEVFPVFSKIIWNPSNPILRGISRFCYPFPWFLGQIPVYQGLILLRDFLIFLRDIPIFSIRFLIFWVRFRFSEKVVNSKFVDWFPLFIGSVSLFLGPFPVFKKSFKFSVCQSVSFFLGPFPHFLGSFPVFKNVSNTQFVDRFPLFFGSVSSFFGSISSFQKKF